MFSLQRLLLFFAAIICAFVPITLSQSVEEEVYGVKYASDCEGNHSLLGFFICILND